MEASLEISSAQGISSTSSSTTEYTTSWEYTAGCKHKNPGPPDNTEWAMAAPVISKAFSDPQ